MSVCVPPLLGAAAEPDAPPLGAAVEPAVPAAPLLGAAAEPAVTPLGAAVEPAVPVGFVALWEPAVAAARAPAP
ncbi:MAG TPA: hypothetical protein VFN67_16335 [Polyangiales bacterium]|nr:hypothetical protein [Polyangiales bacterium]